MEKEKNINEEAKKVEKKEEKTLGQASIDFYNKVVRKEALKEVEREM